ncbi:galactokinase [Nakamurella aerolata]|uniref:Galactokinase n=1 Tax=Nakamurella aerolata TaxID=1656892 RepID=A0A849AC67_9ACTN|nr:galactokinase [Nakamurella aerolata]NNG36751.1 galactokinase [Nakamurella aerolata]
MPESTTSGAEKAVAATDSSVAADPVAAARQLFVDTFGSEPAGVWSAPGRVNLIGEHTDYNDGLVLPFAIDARTAVAGSSVPAGGQASLEVLSAHRPDEHRTIPLGELTPDPERTETDWSDYVSGSVWAARLHAAGPGAAGTDGTDGTDDAPPGAAALPGLRFAVASTVPVGAGLSSSAALECAVVLATLALDSAGGPGTDRAIAPEQLARIAQRAENHYVGVPTGLMDQMASSAAEADHLLFFDVGADTIEQIPFDIDAAGLSLLVIDTRAHHSLADGEYAKRRAECERAAELLGLNSLRDIDIDQLDLMLAKLVAATRSSVLVPAVDDAEVLVRRVRHIVTENQRVLDVVTQLRSASPDWGTVGRDMTASHASLRDDYQVSADELDVAVDAALSAGAVGARMTGGGFGGSAIALVPAERAATVSAAVEKAFAAAGFTAPVIRSVHPAAGARRDH